MGTWTALQNQPGFNASTMLLLTDGTVMCHDEGPAFGGSPRWHKLTPNHHGSYIHGTWSALAHAPNSPLFFASAVLLRMAASLSLEESMTMDWRKGCSRVPVTERKSFMRRGPC